MDDRCKTCRHGDLRWDEEPCESCCGANDGYEPRGDRMDRYDPYTDKFLRDTQYGILGTDVPDINVGDTISRQAVIDALSTPHGILYPIRTIENMPSAQPKKGKWIPQDMNKSYGMISTAVYYYPKCSVCGQSANYTNFCPNCGAKMEED